MSKLEILLWSWSMFYILTLPGLWKVFEKLDIQPWYSLIPVLNFIVLMQYYELSMWLLLLILLGPVWLIILFLLNYKISKSFGFNFGFAIGLTIWFTRPIFISMLGFGGYEFIGKEGLV